MTALVASKLLLPADLSSSELEGRLGLVGCHTIQPVIIGGAAFGHRSSTGTALALQGRAAQPSISHFFH